MSRYWYPANWTDREWFDPHALDDNAKYPIDQTAVALFELLGPDGRWADKRIVFLPDNSDLPWDPFRDRPAAGPAWTNINDVAKRIVAASGFVWKNDEPELSIYRTTRCIDEQAGRNAATKFLPSLPSASEDDFWTSKKTASDMSYYILCADGLSRHLPYHNQGDAECDAETIDNGRPCARLYGDPGSGPRLYGRCPGGPHTVEARGTISEGGEA